jgi:hypothetical protein
MVLLGARYGMVICMEPVRRNPWRVWCDPHLGDGLLALAGKSGKVCQYRCDQIAMMAVVQRQASGVQVQNVARLCRRFGPRSCRNRQKLGFQYCLPIAQVLCIVLDFSQNPPDVGGFLGRHAASLVEIERAVTHGTALRRCVAQAPADSRRSMPLIRKEWSKVKVSGRERVIMISRLH